MQVNRSETGDVVEIKYPVDLEQWRSAVRAATTLLYVGAHASCAYFALDTAHLDAWYDTAHQTRRRFGSLTSPFR
jgi:hypothetical protein